MLKVLTHTRLPCAEKDIAKSGEILHSYGVLSDAQLLQTYGFVPNLPPGVSNPDNSLPVTAADVMACCQRPTPQVGHPFLTGSCCMMKDRCSRKLECATSQGVVMHGIVRKNFGSFDCHFWLAACAGVSVAIGAWQ